MENVDNSQQNKHTIIAMIVIILIIGLVYLEKQFDKNPERGCDCARILDVPTFKVSEYSMPLPVDDMSNEDFREYESCYKEFAGVAGATLECAGK